MKKTKKLSVGRIVGAALMAILLVFTIVLNVLALTQFDNIFEQFFGSMPNYYTGDTLGADTQYVKSSFSGPAALYSYEERLVADIAMEGVTLLKNDGLLPLDKGTTLSLFSHSSVDLVSGGSGSGSGSFELTKNLKEGLNAAGLKVNETLWSFYSEGAGSAYTRGIGVINYGQALDWTVNECPLSVLTADSAVTASYGDSVAMFVLSRTGGEGGDEARDMAAYGGKSGTHYLEPDETELEIIDYLDKNFDSVILLVNCNNAMELGWAEKYSHIRAIVNFPGAGRTGTYGLGYVLTGFDADGNEISPSGHLVDTLVYDNFSSPASQNMGDFRYDGTDYYYVVYSEGIYVGYRYYETRYEDTVTGRAGAGDYDYASTVLYPFGYGLSYTDFAWSDFTVSGADENGNIEVGVTVTNTGERAGKDVVEVYVQSPYTDYDIANGVEKSAVSLVGFAKTALLKPGESERVSVNVNVADFVSYDARGAGTYILENGTYYITAASNAHKAVDNILSRRGYSVPGESALVGEYEQAEFDSTTYAVSITGEKIENVFDYAMRDDMAQLSRSDWSVMDGAGLRYGTASAADSGAEIGGKQWSHAITDEVKAALDSQWSRNPGEGTESAVAVSGKKGDYDFIDLRGAQYDDPRWEELIDEIPLSELSKLIAEAGYCNAGVSSIRKPKVTDLDGPAGLNKVVGHGSADIGDGYLAMTWPAEYMLACTWNTDLAEQMGSGMGEDGLYSGVVGWYGPAMNIHRTPFAGRNFEYYSEDPFISGKLGFAEVAGAAQKGMYAFVKHFALNDQETHRDHLGLITWANEQTIREIYLKPFYMTLTNNTVTVKYNERSGDGYVMRESELPAPIAIMSSFNRIGETWAGGNYNLITDILREEWGYQGFVLTDYEVGSYMFTKQSLAAGGDAKLTTVDWTKFSLDSEPAYQKYARNAAHHLMFTVVNSAAANGYVHGVEFHLGLAYYKIGLIIWDILVAAGTAAYVFFLAKKLRRSK
ncbi:MAG: glycoside hydrolase family 3 C-terminal domain-containing protein [Oscillospiraceae bacterium]|nr:glycoside hydrolase family 3 C-terminal domain-containing protein [Oscillospiraceae bacterium]